MDGVRCLETVILIAVPVIMEQESCDVLHCVVQEKHISEEPSSEPSCPIKRIWLQLFSSPPYWLRRPEDALLSWLRKALSAIEIPS